MSIDSEQIITKFFENITVKKFIRSEKLLWKTEANSFKYLIKENEKIVHSNYIYTIETLLNKLIEIDFCYNKNPIKIYHVTTISHIVGNSYITGEIKDISHFRHIYANIRSGISLIGLCAGIKKDSALGDNAGKDGNDDIKKIILTLMTELYLCKYN